MLPYGRISLDLRRRHHSIYTTPLVRPRAGPVCTMRCIRVILNVDFFPPLPPPHTWREDIKHTATHTHTHTHTLRIAKQEQSKEKRLEEVLRSCRAVLDVFRSVGKQYGTEQCR